MIHFLAANLEMSNQELALAVLGIIATLIGHHFLFKKYIRDVAGVKETEKNEIGPQPFVTKTADEFVTRASFHKHAELNRIHHEKIEREAKTQIDRLEKSHNNLAREVSSLTSTVDINGDTLVRMDQKLDRLIEKFKA
jgi:hypothetical protein